MDVLEYSSDKYRQAFTIKSNKLCRFKKFQEYPRFVNTVHLSDGSRTHSITHSQR